MIQNTFHEYGHTQAHHIRAHITNMNTHETSRTNILRTHVTSMSTYDHITSTRQHNKKYYQNIIIKYISYNIKKEEARDNKTEASGNKITITISRKSLTINNRKSYTFIINNKKK